MAGEFNKRKVLIFTFLSFFFFSSMLFIVYNISMRMFDNASIMVFIREATIVENILLDSIDFSEKNFKLEKSISKSVNIIRRIQNFEHFISINVYSNKKDPIYTLGTVPDLLKTITVADLTNKVELYNLTKTADKKNRIKVYQVVSTLVKDEKILGYYEITYNLSSLKNQLFKERRVIFAIITIFSFFIVLFLVFMIIQLQTKLSLLSKNYENIKNTDSTTGLRNKDHFYNLLKREIERMTRYGGRVSLATADIDNFTEVNEEFGYEFANMILRTVSSIFSTNFRIFDITGRFAEDEICVLLVNTNEKEAFSALERCRKMIEDNKFYYENREITITVSIGISSVESHVKKDGTNFSTEKKEMIFRNLIFDSINALAKAKRMGKNRTITHSDLFSS